MITQYSIINYPNYTNTEHAKLFKLYWYNLGNVRITDLHNYQVRIRRFAMIISAWWLQTSSKFGGQEYN